MPTVTLPFAGLADRIYRIPLSGSGEQMSRKTLRYIHAIIRGSRQDPVVRAAALQIMREAQVPEKDRAATIVAVHDWVQAHMHYVHDPAGVEWVVLPAILLGQIAATGSAEGDCDDMVTLEQSLLQSAGVETRSVILKADPATPREWSHIYLEAHDGRQWVPLDPIMKDKPPGWAPPRFFAKRAVPVGDGETFPPADGRLERGTTIAAIGRGLGMMRDQWHPSGMPASGDFAWARETGDLLSAFKGATNKGYGAILSHAYAQQDRVPGFTSSPTVGVNPIETPSGYWPTDGRTGGTLAGGFGETTSDAIANIITGVGSGVAKAVTPGAPGGGGGGGGNGGGGIPGWLLPVLGVGLAGIAFLAFRGRSRGGRRR